MRGLGGDRNALGGLEAAPNNEMVTHRSEKSSHPLSSACGRCFMCFAFDPVSMQDTKTKHTKHMPQADDKRCRLGQPLTTLSCNK